MTALPPVPRVLQVIYKMGLVNDEDVINRIHMQYTGSAPTPIDLTLVASNHSTDWGTHIAPNMHTDISLTGIEIVDLTSPTSASGSWTGAIAGGASSGEQLSAGAAMRLNRKINRRYRGGRPGIFLPLTSTAYLVDPQTITGAYVTAVQLAWAELEQAFASRCTDQWASACGSVSVSYYEGAEPFTFPSGRVKMIPKLRVGGPVVDGVVEIQANVRVASQRRRNLTRS